MTRRKIFLVTILIIGIGLLSQNIFTLDFNNIERDSYLNLTSNILLILTAIIALFVKFDWK